VQYAWPVGKPLVDNSRWRALGSPVTAEESYCPDAVAVVDEEIVLLHGFIKKQKKTPQDDLDLAKKRKRLYLENYEEENSSRE
jgi:hypothetical protein